jgi:hypothetical protein
MLEIKSNFWNENGRTLCKPDLKCLRQDHELYKTMLMQLVGKIEYDKEGIRIADENLANAKFNLFIDKAIEENVDLAITPEYSCPWTNIEQFISGNKLPSENNIWVVGCQSIKPQEFKDLTDRHVNVVWIYDESLVQQKLNENKFFDPVCFLLKTRNTDNEVKDVIIVQFKTCNSAEVWERDNFIQGSIFYVIENRINSTRLMTFICSDTLQNIDFNTVNEGYFVAQPLLLIHIQLNQKPFDPSYKRYRNNIYSYGNKDDYNKEVICLNWARGVTFDNENGNEVEFNKYGGSSFYCQTSKIELGDNRINENHKKGLYYTSWKNMKSHVSFLNYEEYVFLIENTKPSQITSLPALRNRTGPKVIRTFSWNNQWNETASVIDGFSQVCSEIEDADGNLNCLTGNDNFMEVERIIQLSSGDLEDSPNIDWSKIINLLSFQISDTEINSRNTFTHDPDLTAKSNRKSKLNRYHSLKNKILTDPQQAPSAFLNAILKFETGSNSKNIYLLNLHSHDNTRKGTAIYLGDKSFAEAKAFKVKIESLFNEDQQGKQVIVWYNNPGLIRIFDEDNKPRISENVSQSPVSFKKAK